MSQNTGVVKVLKQAKSTKVLKEGYALFEVFNSDLLELTKTVCKPDDYYIEGDEITFTIYLRNLGDKCLRDFSIVDELQSVIVPFDDGYHITCLNGNIEVEDNIITFSNLTLEPLEDMEITISGLIG